MLHIDRPTPNGNKNHRVRSQIVDGQRRAALQAVTAARAYLDKLAWAPTIVIAAKSCGSTPSYVAAAIVILRSKDDHALQLVLRGSWSLVETAARLKPRVELIEAFNQASRSDRIALGRTVGVDTVWDSVIAPAV